MILLHKPVKLILHRREWGPCIETSGSRLDIVLAVRFQLGFGVNPSRIYLDLGPLSIAWFLF